MAVAFALGVAIPVACQLLPPFHVLSHEFTQLFTIISVPVLFFAGAGLTQALKEERGELAGTTRMSLGLSRAVTTAAVLGLVAFATMALANALGPDCRFLQGAVFYWITWTPTALLACVGGVVVGDRGWSQPAVLVGAFALSLTHDGLQCWLSLNMVDLMIGKPLAFHQRADMTIPALHSYQRLSVLGIAFCLWNLAFWRRALHEPTPDGQAVAQAAAIRGFLVGGVLCIVIFGFGSHVGWV